LEGRLKLLDVVCNILATRNTIVAKVPIHLEPTVGAALVEDAEDPGNFGRIKLDASKNLAVSAGL